MAAMIKAVVTSNTECCLINIVDKIIEEANRNDEIRMMGLFLKQLLRAMAKCAPKELYTCMLGHKLVGVSVLYRAATICVKMLSLGMVNGLR